MQSRAKAVAIESYVNNHHGSGQFDAAYLVHEIGGTLLQGFHKHASRTRDPPKFQNPRGHAPDRQCLLSVKVGLVGRHLTQSSASPLRLTPRILVVP